MALLAATAFGLQTTTFGYEWNSTTGSPTIETSIARSNGTALRFASGANKVVQWNAYSSGQGVKFYRAYIYIVSTPTVNTDFVTLANGASNKLVLRANSSGALQLMNAEDATQIGTDFTPTTGVWYRFELKVDSTTLASTSVEGRLYAASDEATLAWNPSGTQNLAADPNRFGFNNGSGGLEYIVTDVVIADNSGSVLNDWPGEGSIVYLRPSGAGASTQWARGGADSGANWSQVEETTPNDATDYVESNTSGQIDDYAMTNTPAAVGSGDVIKWVAPGLRFAMSATTSTDPLTVMRVTGGGNTEESAAFAQETTTWTSYVTGSTFKPPMVLTDLPGASTAAWTKSDLDSMQAGVRCTVTDTHFFRVSALWVMFEHKAGGGGPPATGQPTMARWSGVPGMRLGSRVGGW